MSPAKDHVSKKSQEIPSFKVMDILERAQAMEADGQNIIHLEIGEPDFDTPEPVRKAGIKAIDEGYTKYTHSLGLMELRNAICEHYRDEYGASVSSERVMVTSGTSNALFLILAAILDPGDEVIMADPGYACYPNFVNFLGGKPVFAPVIEEEGFTLAPKSVANAITDRTRAILINSPANPTGALLDGDDIKRISELGPLVISDEIYLGMVYESRSHSVLEYSANSFVINGFSKRNAMTGWRLGYAISPPDYVRPMQKMQQNFNISANSFAQWGGVSALREGKPYVEVMAKEFSKRRTFMLNELTRIGLPVKYMPKGAFYIMANSKMLGPNSLSLAYDILDKTGVAVTPGSDFGPGGEGYLRFSYANSLHNISLAMERLENYIKSRPNKF